MSETCRVIINQVKQKLHLVGYLLIQYFKDARYHEHKKKKKINIRRWRFGRAVMNLKLIEEKGWPSEEGNNRRLRKLLNEELYNLYCLSNIIKVINSADEMISLCKTW